MKKFFSIFFIFMCLVCCGLFYGCGDKYASLTFSVEVSYDGAINVEDLENGSKRVTLKNGGAFDDHLDGSYTFYIVNDSNTKTTATIEANFSGAPSDFNYEVSHSLSTEIISVSGNVKYTGSGVKKEITATSKGKTELTLVNVESGKKDKVIIDVVEVASSMSFIDKNLAIVGREGSTLTLNNEIVLLSPKTSSLTNISYSIGELNGENNFVAWSDNELLSHGLRFNKRTSVIDVFEETNLKIKNFYIMATYDNPVGDDLAAVTEVKIVNAITNFEIYKGTTARDAKLPENLIESGDINDLIVNIEGLSDKDIILKVRSNGEEVNFDYLRDSAIPVYFPDSRFTTQYFQPDGETLSIYDGETKSYYKNATYCLCFIKICAATKTTLNDRYPSGTYTVKFTSDYANYKVDKYPLATNFIVKNDNLITSFSVNGYVQENFSIIENKKGKPFEGETYINSSSAVNGTSFNIDVGNTDSILQANKKFYLSLYKYNPVTEENEEVTGSLSQYFSVKRGVGKSTNLVNVIDNFESSYDCNSTFYFVPNAISGKVSLGDIFYLVVTAEKPIDRPDKQAKATIKLNVVQGIQEFTEFSYSYSKFKVDPETGAYVVNPATGEKEVEDFTGRMTFNEELESNGSIDLDLSSGFEATFILSYLPEGASLNNIEITTSNDKVLEIKRNEDEKNKFYVRPHDIGQEWIYISVTHLEVQYAISINVYNPISNFNIRLNSTSVASGVGAFTVNEENDILTSTVQVRKEIYLNLTTTPVTSNQFSIEYFAYLGEVNQDNLLAKYSINYKGEASSAINVIGDADFMFTCATRGNKNNCSFLFPTDTSVGKVYTIVITLTNLDGSVITKSFTLNSYVPIKNIKTDVTSRLLYNPNTLSYQSKTNDINDPSVFGLKIETLADNKNSEVTYDFKNYGRIIIFVNNIQETIFNCSNGRLTSTGGNNLLTLVNEYPDGDGYYWFKLNENYDFSNVIGSVFYSIQINQLGMWFTQTNSFRAVDAEAVTTLETYTGEHIYYKQGYSQDDLIDIQVVKDTAFNKNLHVKVYDIITLGKTEDDLDGTSEFYYDLVENTEQNVSCVTSAKIENGKTSSQFNLRINPNVAGKSVIIVMPEDKIITREDYDKFTLKSYKQISITKQDFEPNIFYIKIDAEYVLATEYKEGTTYYTLSTDLDSVLSLWKYCLVFYMTVADGVKVPYQISSYDDLKEISNNEDSVTKRYVFTKDVVVPSSENWKAIGNYYLAGKLSNEDFNNGTFYLYDGEGYVETNAYSSEEEYFSYGFNGELSGMYSYKNVKTKQKVDSYYKVTGISFEGIENASLSGFISITGSKASLIDLNINYGVFRPSIKDTYTFGGLTAVNFGKIKNSITSFDNFTIATGYKTIIGGLVGENKGTIENSKVTNVGVKGTMRVVAQNTGVNLNLGGLVGVNRKEVLGSYICGETVEYTFNDAGFNSTLNIIAELDVDASGIVSNSSIGCAVGTNYGLVKNLAIKGSINAQKFDNVGGLIGNAEGNKNYNDLTEDDSEEEKIKYSVDSSYSIATIIGNDYVGGAIGRVNGSSASNVNLYYVSAENYATNTNYARVFVQGKNNVGGLIGGASYANIKYCYVVSYFDCMPLQEAETEEVSYDIVGSNAGGFIGSVSNAVIENSASFVNVRGEQSADLFVQTSTSLSVSDVFVIGYAIANSGITHNLLSANVQGYFYYIASDEQLDNIVIRDSYSPNANIQAENIILNFNAKDGWEINANTNNGLPYLTITFSTGVTEPLFATTPINVSATVKSDENEFISYIKDKDGIVYKEVIVTEENFIEGIFYIKVGKNYVLATSYDSSETYYLAYKDSSIIIFFNYDYLNKYLAEDINKLNIVSFLEFINLYVYPTTNKSARLDISTSNSKVISIDSQGLLKLMGEGRVTLTISSKLNANFKAEVYVVVKYGVSNIDVSKDISSNISLNGSEIRVLKSNTQTLFANVYYNRDLEHETDAILKPSNEVGIRFRVATNVSEEDSNNGISSLDDILNELDEAGDINGLFKFNGDTWLYDGQYWYVDISSGRNPVITPVIAMNTNQKLKIEYVPYIKSIFNTFDSTIMLDRFAGTFNLSIIKGATNIIFENNLDTTASVEISQLETHTFTVTLFTDYELDEILDNFTEENVNRGNLLSIVKSDITYKYADNENKKNLESISATYTINYKDKLNAVEEDIEYNFNFRAVSDSNIQANLKFVVVSQDKINQVYGTIYSKINDFPQTPNNNSVVYNGQVGVISVEVYPYFSNYNSMRVYYRTPSAYPVLVTQLSYDITGESGRFLINYPESGAIQDMSGVMKVEKSSGQDSYLLNTNGTYSYSKVYFFSLLVGTDVPDRTNFTFYVEFLNRDGTIIETFAYNFTSVVQPSVQFKFDDKLKGEDGLYYLPINTVQELGVNLVNFKGEINWSVSSVGNTLTQNEVDVLSPYKDEQGNYKIKVFNYENSSSSDNVFTTDSIGKHITITATIRDNENTYTFSQTFIVTLFTVTGVHAQNVSRGYMTIPMSTTTPLQVTLDVAYDESVVNNLDNWYANWYTLHGSKNDNNDTLYKYLTACGYEIEEYFSRYFIQLSNAVAKASYNYKDNLSTKISGVWFYDSGDENSGYLQVNKDYNNSTFGVEQYNEYISVYGYQIDRNSKISLRANISYTNNEGEGNKLVNVGGIPNVYHYSISLTDSTFDGTFKFEDNFILNFVYKSDLINAIPISTPEEFLAMKEGFDYRLVNDIELADYIPLSTPIASLDGNNYNIYITSFGYSADFEEKCVLGLFDTVSEKTMLYNVTVYYTNRIMGKNNDRLIPSLAPLSVTQLYVQSISFGGIASTNNGVLTNCKTTGKLSITINNDINVGAIPEAINGGLVATNSETGYITNSSVYNFDLSTHGITGGVVGVNSGKVVSSYFNESSLTNVSSAVVAGFVYNNTTNGKIYECYTQGYRANNDNDIRNTGTGIVAEGDVGGFVYSNNGNIADCYSNISLKSSSMLAGFVYSETSTSVISRCYSISYKSSTDNSRIASPFAGANSADYSRITINGQLNYCYYLTGDTWTKAQWESTSENKQAKELTLDEFSTHTNFVSYDLSLVYNDKQTYADGKERYSYVDGYTWVIIEGKPVIVSTLIRTISQRGYVGKTKNYSEVVTYYNKNDFKGDKKLDVAPTINIGQDKLRTNYYNNPEGKAFTDLTAEDLVFYTIQDNTKKTFTYYYSKGINDNNYNDAITITFKIDLENGKAKIIKESISAEYGTEDIVVLDARIKVGSSYIEDSNFRANDTIEVEFDEDTDLITRIDYKVLENASYYYNSNTPNVSDVVGTRTNPQIIYDYESFEYYLKKNTAGQFFRIINDIDFIGSQGYFLPKTVYSNFQGALQGNYMALNQISISYVNYLNGTQDFDKDDDYDDIVDDQEAFGLFGTISTVPDIKDFNTVVSNVSLNVVEVLSNTHQRVGALAGLIHTTKTSNTGTRLILNNISIGGMGNRTAYIQGKNAAGGLAGIILGDVIIKDITVSANVNATKDVSSGNIGAVLYTDSSKIDNLSYAGGVAGILDCNAIIDPSTHKNYNASNVHTYGSVHVTGGVIGLAFGLVGRNSVVNYVNVDIANTANNYIESSVYAGGLVGENRGTIISSSVSYRDLENYSTVKIATSTLIQNPLFRSSAGSDSAVASGGLVGLNNGGKISNSISTVDVRDSNTNIAGGAVGRMLTGTLENIISSGSLMSKGIIGGLVGTANDTELVIKAGYDENAIAKTSVDGKEKTTIRSCVAATNWMALDFWQYDYLQINNNAIAGFIGLIAYSASNENFIEFEQLSYYTNTMYTSTNATTPQKYLKVAHFSNTLDLVADVRSSARGVLTDASNEQTVFPYSIREAYYEDTYTGVSYTMNETTNKKPDNPDTSPYIDKVYELTNYNVENVEDFYVVIDFDDPYWESIGYKWNTDRPTTYDKYVEHFGKIYQLEDNGSFRRISSESAFNSYKEKGGEIYYIRSRTLQKFRKTTRYATNGFNDISLDISTSNGAAAGSKFNEYTFTAFSDLDKIGRIYINGLEISNLGDKTAGRGDVDGTEYYAEYANMNFPLPNSTKIVKLAIYAKCVQLEIENEGFQRCWQVTSVDLTYEYDRNSPYVTVQTTRNNSATSYTYSLHISSKSVIYNSFINNGYWRASNEFLLDASLGNTYDQVDKYLTNLEFANIYLWSEFADENWGKDYDTNTVFAISTPEELAMFSNMVNSGKTFESKTVELVANVDLSGKFWVPIGSEENPFMGTFDGKENIIKYATVNADSNASVGSIGGVFGLVKDATIKNLITIGGDIYGVTAGGIIAVAKGEIKINNVSNRNNVTGEETAGGIIGRIEESISRDTIEVLNSVNFGDVDHQNKIFGKDQIINLGGIIGHIDSNSSLIGFENLQNYGSILAISNRTSYAGSGVKIELNIGGIIGNVQLVGDNFTELNNHGNITITTNAHLLNVGGVIGITKDATKVNQSKNYATINVTYNNIYSEGLSLVNRASALIGGIIGVAKDDISACGNEGEIDFNLSTTSSSFIAIGGVVGSACGNVEMSYNSNNIEVYTITRRTFVTVGGVVGGTDIRQANRKIENCYNSGDIQATSSSVLYAGGIAGASYVEDDEGGGRDIKFTGDRITNNHLEINMCLNVGYVNIIAIAKYLNGLGAIAGYANFNMQFNANYYLRDSAYSGNTIYKAYCLRDEIDKDDENNDEEDKGYYSEDGTQNYPKLITSLKNQETYVGWNFVNSEGVGVWQQYYDTWYPSLKENNSSSMWSDKLEEVSQERGSFVVKSAEELAYLAEAINSGEIDSTNITIKLTNFIDLSNRYWIPIGTKEYTFKGTFDGNGYVIRNLTIDGYYIDNDEYGGLFGYCENATIKDVGLENTIIQNVNFAGAIAYNVENSSISRVYTDGAQESKDAVISGLRGAGGLVFNLIKSSPLYTDNYDGGIYYSYNNLPVRVVGGENVVAAGGLVGNLENSNIYNSYNNVNGEVSTTQILETLDGANNGCVIAGIGRGTSSLLNVFNLSPLFRDGKDSNGYKCDPLLYRIVENGEYLRTIEAIPQTPPIYSNLVADEDGIPLSDIWTQQNEYTLNEPVDGVYYPSIRGLGGSWKNTESEALIAIDYENIQKDLPIYLQQLKDDGIITDTSVSLYEEERSNQLVYKKTYYLVTTEEELAWISTNVNSGNLLTTNSEFILLNDLDLSGRYWTPIGSTSVYSFQGIFNMNGHEISGLTIDSSVLYYGGLFGYTNGAKIVNGYITDAFVKLISSSEQTNVYAGAIVGRGYNTSIENIFVSTAISVTSNSAIFVGGAIGSFTGTKDYILSNVRVEKAYNNEEAGNGKYARYIDINPYYNQVVELRNENGTPSGKIDSNPESKIGLGAFSEGGNVYVGGVIGYSTGYGMDTINDIKTIESAYSEVNVAAVTKSNASRSYAGGILGYAQGEVKMDSVFSSSIVKTFTNQYDFVGGIAGYVNNSNISNAYFEGYIEPCQDLDNHIISRAGGIVAFMETEGILEYCVNKGTINSNGDYIGNTHIGGIIGFCRDRGFSNDRGLVYVQDAAFSSPIGYYEIKATAQENPEEEIARAYTDKTGTITVANGFKNTLWSGGKLIQGRTLIKGIDDSIVVVEYDGEVFNAPLEGKGVQVCDFSSVKLRYANEADYDPSDKLVVSFRNRNGEYVYKEYSLSSATFELSKIMTGSDIDTNSMMVCFVQIVKTNIEPTP